MPEEGSVCTDYIEKEILNLANFVYICTSWIKTCIAELNG